jgi:sulfonate transport system substrate-binding protein
MDNAATKAALVTKDVDAAIGNSDLLALRDQGAVRIIYTTKGDPRFACNSTILASDEFVRKYPAYTKRVLRQYVLAAKQLTEKEGDPAEIYRLWSKSGVPFSSFKEDWAGETFASKASPLIDPYLISRYQRSIADAKKYGLIRSSFPFEPWVDTSFLEQILKEENLQNLWKPEPAL